MQPFWISKIYDNEDHGRTIYINPLPEKYCTFDCVFCDLGRSIKDDQPKEMPGTVEFIHQLENVLREQHPEKVMIMPAGEGLINNRLSEIIRLIKRYGSKVGLLSNGYILNSPAFHAIVAECDEVIGELMVVNETDFQKLLRPLSGYTLAQHVANMDDFRRTYRGHFALSLNLLKGYSDYPEAVCILKGFLQRLQPDELEVVTPEEGPFMIPKERLVEIQAELEADLV